MEKKEDAQKNGSVHIFKLKYFIFFYIIFYTIDIYFFIETHVEVRRTDVQVQTKTK